MGSCAEPEFSHISFRKLQVQWLVAKQLKVVFQRKCAVKLWDHDHFLIFFVLIINSRFKYVKYNEVGH